MHPPFADSTGKANSKGGVTRKFWPYIEDPKEFIELLVTVEGLWVSHVDPKGVTELHKWKHTE